MIYIIKFRGSQNILLQLSDFGIQTKFALFVLFDMNIFKTKSNGVK